METGRRPASLSVEEARARAGSLSVRHYQVELDLTGLRHGHTLRSRSIVTFTARLPGATSFVDIVADSVEASLDGVRLPGGAFDGERLHLSPLGGDHQLEVTATITRTRERTGIHRAVDPTDNEVYVWTNCEPDDARRVYACFDQPDLKAPVTFTVHAPLEWTVVSNSAVRHSTDRIGGAPARTWVFDDTPPLSTYVTAICAGPFHRLSRTVDGYELALLARRSLASYLDEQADELFDLTATGLRYFADRFGIAFPQRTYTQVFCPDLSGAMENWGCVTWSDQFLFRATPTDAQRYNRVVFLLHEMAHMWFGDLVTLRWWDDLWLNESFADWAALEAAEQATSFTGAWRWYLGSRKEAGYIVDGGPVTHPIRQDIPTAAHAQAAFDGLTYGKGASVLRQLAAHVGEPRFLAGLRRYFTGHAYGNATLADLLFAVGDAAGADLGDWSGQWLNTAGTDVVTVSTDVQPDGRYREVRLHVIPPDNRPAQRNHRLPVGVYDLRDGRLVPRRRITLDAATGIVPITELAGDAVADLVLPNDGDLTFARVRPDRRSLRALLRHGHQLPDPDGRALVRIILWHLIEDGLLPPTDLIAYATRALEVETDAVVRDDLLRTAVATVRDWTGEPGVANDQLGTVCLELATRAGAESPARAAMLRAALDIASTIDHLTELDRHLGAEIDLRWRWLTRMAAIGHYDEDAVARLLSRDPDPDAVHSALAVEAARPEPEAKDEVWQALFTDRRVPPGAYRAIGQAFWDPGQAAVLRPYPDRFLAELTRLNAVHLSNTAATIVYLFPWHGVDAGFPSRVHASVRDAAVSPMVSAYARTQADTLGRMLRSRSSDSPPLSHFG